MGSLKDCLEKIYGFGTPPEYKALERKVKELRKQGYSQKEADLEAVKYFRGKLAEERESVMESVEKAAPAPEDPNQTKIDFAAKDTEAMPSGNIKRRQTTQPATQTQPIPEGLKRSETLKHVEKVLGLPVRIGKFRQNALGIYKKTPEVVRLKKANDIGVAAHEVAHHIQNLVGLGGRMPQEVRAMSYTQDPKKINREGFAEFVRYYIVDEAKVKSEAPAFLKTFLDALDKHPDVAEVFTRIKESWNAWEAATPVQKIASLIRRGEDAEGRRYTFDQFYTDYVDELHPIKLLSDAAAERSGEPLEPVKDPFMLAWLTRGWTRKADQMLKFGTFQTDNDKGIVFTGKSLREILKPIEQSGEMEMLDVFLLAKRAKNDPRIIRGFEGVLSEKDFAEAEKELEPKYGSVADELYEFQDEVLQYFTQRERISEDMADSYRKNNAFYAPLYRVMDDAPPGSRFSKTKFSDVPNPAKRLKGSSRDVWSPTENILKNVYALVNSAERNSVGVAILGLTKIKGMGDMVERIPFPIEPQTINKSDFIALLDKYGKTDSIRNVQETQTETEKVLSPLRGPRTPSSKLIDVAKEALEKRGFSKAEAQQIVDRIGKAGTPQEKSEIIEKTIEKTVIFTIKEELNLSDMPDSVIHTFRPAYRAGPNEAIFYEKGKPILVEMAPELARAIRGIDPEGFDILTRILSLPAKTLRAGATLTPEFASRNPIRDQTTAFVFSKYGYIPGWDMIRGLYHIMKVDELYQQYNASGAANSSLVSLDREYISKRLSEITRVQTPGEMARHPFRTGRNFIIASAKNPLKIMQIISEITEETSRVGGFTRALKREGGDMNAVMRAALEGRDMTVDFGRRGAKIRALNAITAFQGAGIQGVDKMFRAFKERPGTTFLKAFMMFTVPSVLLWLAQSDDPYYDEIPDWRKILFHNIITRNKDGSLKHIWSLPLKGFGIGILFGAVPVMALDWMKKKDPVRMKKAVTAFLESMIPNVIPTAGIPWIENYANRSLFFDRPISPRSTEPLSPYLQYSEQTSETMKLIARGMNHIPILKEYANPAKLENFLRGYSGGTGTYATESTDELLRAAGVIKQKTEPTMRLSELPLIRGFMQRWPTANAQSIEDFYQLYTKNKTLWEDKKEIANVRGTGIEMKPTEKIAGGMPPELLYQEKVAQALTFFRKTAREIQKSESYTPDQKREALDAVYLSMTNLARLALKRPPLK